MTFKSRREFLATGAAAWALQSGLASAFQNDSQNNSPFAELSRLVEARMAGYRVPGVAFGVYKNGQMTTQAFGLTNIDNPQPVTTDTLFPVASISKTVATTAIMRLIEMGRIELKAPVQKYLPNFRVQDEGVSRSVTIWHLLTHTPGWEGQLNTDDRGSETLSNFVAGMHDLPQLSEPGSVWSYNNAGFGVAGRVIEVVYGKSIHDALRELVFAPLELTRAFTRTGDFLTYRFAAPHRERSAGQTEVIRPFELSYNVTAGGAAFSISDLLSYARFHLAGGKILSTASLELMRTPQLRKNSTDDEMGVGWHLRRVGGVMTAAHGGTLGGHCLHIQLVPARNLAFCILTNHNDGWRLIQDVERATLKLYEGLALTPGQLVGHRGVNEAMSAISTPLARQPDLAQYVGSYQRPPLGTVVVKDEAGTLVVSGTGGAGPARASMVFYGPDAAYATSGSFTGSPFEFVRTPSGQVGWIRINGRVARKV
jgi:CubicO group peptidase (beta-lactamase class C family)